MATITASLERSLQNCSLNHQSSAATSHHRRGRRRPDPCQRHLPTAENRSCGGGGRGGEIVVDDESRDYHVTLSNASSSSDNSTFVELNSHVSLPYHWEQCLDLKTGEVYYINWSNGVKAKEDPRTKSTGYNGDYYSEEEEEQEEEDNEVEGEEEEDGEEESYTYDSEGSSTESNSAPSSSSNFRSVKRFLSSRKPPHYHQSSKELTQDSVLVVAGCKSCLMYHMVPRHVLDCPKCCGQLLHFGANNNNNTPSSP